MYFQVLNKIIGDFNYSVGGWSGWIIILLSYFLCTLLHKYNRYVYDALINNVVYIVLCTIFFICVYIPSLIFIYLYNTCVYFYNFIYAAYHMRPAEKLTNDEIDDILNDINGIAGKYLM